MDLPGDIGSDASEIPNQDIRQMAIANRAAHGSADIDSISNRFTRG
jgi:hypothetical protein